MADQPWRIVAATVLIVGLGVALVWAVSSSGSDANAPAKVGTVTDTSLVTVAPTTTAAASSTSTTTTGPVVAEEVVAAVEESLAAWGSFAVTGELGYLEGTFVEDGPQWAQLETEALNLAAAPLGFPAYTFTLSEVEIVRDDSTAAVVRAEVVMTRPGEPEQPFRWDIHMRLVGSRWALWTVETTP